MTATILDGKATLAAIKSELRGRVQALADRGVVPGLGTVLVGDDPASRWYVAAKHRDCAELGIASIQRELPAGTTQAQVEAVVDELNADPSCTAFLVQQPTGLDEYAILSRVDPVKDVDGLHPYNLGSLVLGQAAPLPCTPMGIIELLRRYDVPINGAHAVVIGRGLTVGRPMGLLLTRRTENATVTLCHTGTRDLAALVAQADIVIAAAGVPDLVTADMVKPGAAVLDVGVSRVDGRIVGDIDAGGRAGRRICCAQSRWCRTDDQGHVVVQCGAGGGDRLHRRVTDACGGLRLASPGVADGRKLMSVQSDRPADPASPVSSGTPLPGRTPCGTSPPGPRRTPRPSFVPGERKPIPSWPMRVSRPTTSRRCWKSAAASAG